MAFVVVGEDFVDDRLVDALVVDESVLDLGQELQSLPLLLVSIGACACAVYCLGVVGA